MIVDREDRAVFTEQLRNRRGRGRPRRRTPIVVTTVKLPEDVFDALYRRSLVERHESLHALLREVLTSYAVKAASV